MPRTEVDRDENPPSTEEPRLRGFTVNPTDRLQKLPHLFKTVEGGAQPGSFYTDAAETLP